MLKYLLIALLLSFVLAKVNIIHVEKRGIANEPIVMEVEVRAPCEAYLGHLLSTIEISSVSNPTCLPINSTDTANDDNDLNAHVFCTNFNGGRKSIFRLHEVYPANNETETRAPGSNFILSWISNFPFIENSRRFSYLRRPTCSVATDVCSTTEIVNQCYDNPVEIQQGYVRSSERVYFITPGLTVGTCDLNKVCCPYISTSAVSGICGGTASCVGVVCNDNNNCTTDTCNAGVCIYTPITCNSGNLCLIDGQCQADGTCTYSPNTCNDNIACTIDSCNSTGSGSCQHLTNCNGDSCNLDGVCNANKDGICTYTPKNCNDNNNCTVDSCSTTSGCQNDPIVCTTNNFCDTNPQCNPANGLCETTPYDCTDPTGSLCTLTATCNSSAAAGAGACQFTYVQCDNNACLTNGVCQNATGECNFSSTICTAPNACQIPLCNDTTGCYTIPKPCSDSNPCTIDACVISPSSGKASCTHTDFCSLQILCYNCTCTNPCAGQSSCPLDDPNIVGGQSENTTFIELYCNNTINNCPSNLACNDTYLNSSNHCVGCCASMTNLSNCLFFPPPLSSKRNEIIQQSIDIYEEHIYLTKPRRQYP